MQPQKLYVLRVVEDHLCGYKAGYVLTCTTSLKPDVCWLLLKESTRDFIKPVKCELVEFEEVASISI